MQQRGATLKVCVLAYTFYESDMRVIRYAEALAQRGDLVEVIALRREGRPFYEKLNGVRLYRIQKRILNEHNKLDYLKRLSKFFVRSMAFLIKRHIHNRGFDLIHVHSVPDFEVFAAWVPKLTGAKIILDIHDIVPEFYASKFNTDKGLLYKLLIKVERLSCSFADHVISSNHIWEKTLTSRSLRPEKCTTILNYPDPTIFYRRPRALKNGKFIILYPGTLNWHQGIDIAIRGLHKIKDQFPHVEFHIYGEGDTKEALSELITDLNLEGRVFLKDPVPVREIANLMAMADLGLVPKRKNSFGNEAFSTKTLEFMSLGVPMLISDTRIDRYYFDDSLVTFFRSEDVDDLAEKMRLLLSNSTLRERTCSNSIEYVQANNWGSKKKMYFDLVDSLVNGS